VKLPFIIKNKLKNCILSELFMVCCNFATYFIWIFYI